MSDRRAVRLAWGACRAEGGDTCFAVTSRRTCILRYTLMQCRSQSGSSSRSVTGATQSGKTQAAASGFGLSTRALMVTVDLSKFGAESADAVNRNVNHVDVLRKQRCGRIEHLVCAAT